MENMGISNLVTAIKNLNPTVKIEMNDNYIIGNKPATKLRLPNGYYYNEKNGINNKHNTESGMYETYSYIYHPTRPLGLIAKFLHIPNV